MVRRKRLRVGDVECCPTDDVVLQCPHQVIGDDVTSAGHVHDPCVAFHHLEFRTSDDAAGLCSQRQCEHHHIGPDERVDEIPRADHVVRPLDVLHVPAHDRDVAAERCEKSQEGFGDSAAAEDGDACSEKVAADGAGPSAFARVRPHVPQSGQCKCKRVLGDRFGMDMKLGVPYRMSSTVVEYEADRLLAWAHFGGHRWRYELDRQATSLKEKDKSLERYIAHQTLISRVLPHPSGRAFFSADWDGTLLGWLPYSADDQAGEYDRNLFGGRFFGGVGTFLNAARAPDRGIASAAISGNGERIALGAEDGNVEVWEVRGFAIAARAPSHSGRVVSVAWAGTREAPGAQCWENRPQRPYSICNKHLARG